MGEIKDALVVGIGMDSGHHATDNTEVFQQHLGDRSQAVGGAGGIGNDLVGTLVVFFVDPHTDGDIGILAGRGDDDFGGAGS